MNIYDAAWKKYRRLQFTFIALFAGFIPFCLMLWLLNHMLPSDYYGVLLVPYFVRWIVAGIRFITFHCPRCDERFAMTWWYSTGGFNTNCVRCGLHKFAQTGGD